MAKLDSCEIVMVIDRSGSMGTIVQDAIGSLNTFLDEQKNVPGEANVTVILFNDEYHVLYDGISLVDVVPFDDSNYKPSGLTAMLDAIGKAIDVIGERLSKLGEQDRPEKVLIAILTDGLENASKEYNRGQIFEKIKTQRDIYKWEFAYLAANQDAFAEGAKLGIDKSMTMDFSATGIGVRKGVATLCSRTASFRTSK